MIHSLKTPDLGMERRLWIGLGLPRSENDQTSEQIHRNQVTMVVIHCMTVEGHNFLEGRSMTVGGHIVLQR